VIQQALSYAIRSEKLELVRYLKSLGWLKVCHSAPDCQPLHSAVNAGANPTMVEFLISENFDVNAFARVTNRTPLQLAAIRANFELVEALCENGADPNVTYRMPNGETYPTALKSVKRDLSVEFRNTEADARLKSNLTKIREYLEGGQCRKK
jgi:ankyrin repeat protein